MALACATLSMPRLTSTPTTRPPETSSPTCDASSIVLIPWVDRAMDRVSGRERGVRVGSSRGMTTGGEGTPKMEAGTHRPAGEVEALIPRHGLVYLHHGVAPRPEHPPRQRVVVSPGLILIPEGELRGLSGAGRERSQRMFEGAHWCDGPVRASRSIGRERRREASERASSRDGHGWLVTRRLREKRSAGDGPARVWNGGSRHGMG